jgi:tRNA(fMet)-specific endonuclease VapC
MKLLDTVVLTLFHTGHAKICEHVVSATDVVATTVVSRIEVLYGRFDALMKAADGQQLVRAQQRLVDAEREFSKFRVVPIDATAAAQFDEFRVRKGLKRIGRADLLIASIAVAHGATLVTRNLRHFRQVPGLQLDNWAD